jgi:hypothetical protein
VADDTEMATPGLRDVSTDTRYWLMTALRRSVRTETPFSDLRKVLVATLTTHSNRRSVFDDDLIVFTADLSVSDRDDTAPNRLIAVSEATEAV